MGVNKVSRQKVSDTFFPYRSAGLPENVAGERAGRYVER